MNDEIRQIMEGERRNWWLNDLLEKLDAAQSEDPDEYVATVLPYLEGFSDVWESSTLRVNAFDNDAADRHLELIPWLLFSAELWDTEDLENLAYFSYPERIVSLTFGDWRDGYISFKWLAELELERLRRLDLINYGMEPSDAEKLFDNPAFSKITFLRLSGNRFGDRGAKAIAKCPALSNLETLELDVCEIDDEGISAIAASQNLKNLKHLKLGQNVITDVGAEALADATFATNLETLHLGFPSISMNKIGPAGIELLCQSPKFSDDIKAGFRE